MSGARVDWAKKIGTDQRRRKRKREAARKRSQEKLAARKRFHRERLTVPDKEA